MKLHTKLSVSLVAAGFSAMLFISSCSKENSNIPLPEIASLEENSNMRNGVLLIEYLKPTVGQPGKGLFPDGWSGKNNEYGISNGRTLGGNPSLPWVTPLPEPEPGPAGTFITMKSTSNLDGAVYSHFKNLTPGKKYKVTYYVSTTSINHLIPQSPYVASTPHAESVKIHIITPVTMGSNPSVGKTLTFANQKDQWVKDNLYFTASNNSADFEFISHSYNGASMESYTNVYISPNAVEVVP